MTPPLFEPGGPPAAPVPAGDRIVAMDALRGFVLLGILVMNIQSFAMPAAAYVNPTAYGDLTGANLWVWVAGHVFFDQKFIAIFSMLFGAGIVLMSERAGPEGLRLHFRRMGWLILFGLIHAYFFWYGDILFAYGVCGLLVFGLRDRPPAVLLPLAFGLLLAGTLVPVAIGSALTPEQFAEIRDEAWKPTPDVLAAELEAYRGGFVEQLRFRAPESLQFQTVYLLFFVGWRVSALMLIGMALFRLGVFSSRGMTRLHAALAAGGLAIGLPLVVHGMRQHFAHGWSAEYSLFFGGLWNSWGSLFVALGYTGVVAGLAGASVLRPAVERLAAVGRMAFTNYILQTLIATTIFYGHGLGLFGKVERTGQIAIVVAVWAVLLIVSPWWLRRHRFGPLERVWRRLTYGRRMEIRR